MTPWTALLESLHSALVDELIERRPEPKPELGMPQRLKDFALPSETLESALACEVLFGDQRGLVFVALEKDCAEHLGLSAKQLWDAVFRRAGSEFMRRNIRPRLGSSTEIRRGQTLPAGSHQPARLIWIPFKLGGACCYLGMGV